MGGQCDTLHAKNPTYATAWIYISNNKIKC
jgi:hypothetical protein